jgi:pseudouridine kinase
MTVKTVFCFGAANVDVKAHPAQPAILGEEREGRVALAVGGVARNLAENFARLGPTSYLVTCVGADPLGDLLLRETAASGVRLDLVERAPEGTTGAYVAILHPDGTPDYAVSACALLDGLTRATLERHETLLLAADLLVADAHLPAASLSYLAGVARRCAIPLYVNATSLARAPRLLPLPDGVTLLSANRQEAEAMLGHALATRDEAARATEDLVARGPREVILTLGAEGIVYSGSAGTLALPALPAQVVEVTGAGDALCAAFLASRLAGSDTEHALALALAAAALTVESARSVSPLLTFTALEARRSANRPA